MTRKYHNHVLQDHTWHPEEQSQVTYKKVSEYDQKIPKSRYLPH